MPFLAVDEQASTFNVLCDGYGLQVDDDGMVRGYESDFTDTLTSNLTLRISANTSTLHNWYNTTYSVAELIENGPNRVVFHVYDEIRTSAGAAMTGLDSAEAYYYIYPDKLFILLKIITNATSFTISNDTANNYIMGAWGGAQVTGTNGIKLVSGTESSDDSHFGDLTDTEYVGSIATEINTFAFPIRSTLADAGVSLKIGSSERFAVGWDDIAVPASSTQIFLGCQIFDSVTRDGSAKKYTTSASRIELYEQHKSLVL